MLLLVIPFFSRLVIFSDGYQKIKTSKWASEPWGQFKNQSFQYVMGQKPKVLKPCIHKQCEVENSHWNSEILIAQSVSNFYGKPELFPYPILSSERSQAQIES